MHATEFQVPTFEHCRIIATRLAVLVTGVVSWRKISVLNLLYKCLPHTAIWKTVAPGTKPRLQRHLSLQAAQSRYSVALTQIEHDLKKLTEKDTSAIEQIFTQCLFSTSAHNYGQR